MNTDVIVTCALTGAGDTVGRNPHVPVTPAQIAAAALEAARAGATVVHAHVRDPATGKPSRDVALYREVVERIREADAEIVINLTAGMGGDLEIGPGETPIEFGPSRPFRMARPLPSSFERIGNAASLTPATGRSLVSLSLFVSRPTVSLIGLPE